MVGHVATPTGIVLAVVTLSLSTVKVKVTGFTDVSRTVTFPDRRLPDKTFPGQVVSRTRPFPYKTFPGQSLSRADVSRTSYTKEFSCT